MSNPNFNIFSPIPLEECLAKTRGNQRGCSIYTHLKTTCRILRMLRQLYHNTPREKLMIPEADCLAAWHDIGKMTPAFTAKIYNALNLPTPNGLPNNLTAYKDFDHAVAGGRIMADKGKKISNIISNHHGTTGRYAGSTSDADLGGDAWNAMREELLEKLQSDLNLPDCNNLKISRIQQQPLLGMTILADWLSSGMDIEFGTEPSDEDLHGFLSGNGFLPFQIKPDLTFEDIFDFKPNDLQEKGARCLTPGAIHTIECTMGSGKTECALYMAYRLLENKQADGIYFALPTQLTSEKIHERFDKFLGKIFSDPELANSLLIHGESALSWNLKVTNDDDITTSPTPDAWFQTKKRALLAPFAVGTIDQALLSIMRVRHNALRSFALSGKVIIIDELHSYDHYTNNLIIKLIENLNAWGCTIILLSATLTTQARHNFAKISENNLSSAYPLITVSTSDGKLQQQQVESTPNSKIKIIHESRDSSAMQCALAHAANGEQVLWIENTVDKAQEIFLHLMRQLPPRVNGALIHSRYPTLIRNQKEDLWVERFGKHGAAKRQEGGSILVGTQILEQSLDIDADFLISRMAPADMIFQRCGRLWRHKQLDKIRPAGSSRSMMLLTLPEWETPEQLVARPSSTLPYDAYTIYRSIEVFKSLNELEIPTQIRPLLEEVYAPRNEENPALSILLGNREKSKKELENQAMQATGHADKALDEEHVKTRDGDEPTVKLFLLRRNNGGEPLQEKIWPQFSDEAIKCRNFSTPAERLNATRKLLSCSLKIKESLAVKYEDFPTDFLKELLYVGNADARPVRAAYVNEDGTLTDRSGNLLAYKYNNEFGFIKEKILNII